MSATLDYTETVIRYKVAGEQPLDSRSGPQMDPRFVFITVENGALACVRVSGLIYNQDRKLGKREGTALFWDADGVPVWLLQVLVDNDLHFDTAMV